jgi:hypothetical protein
MIPFTNFATPPWWGPVSLTISMVYMVYVVFWTVNLYAVSGTRQAYLSSSIMRTLCLPLFAAYVFSIPVDTASGNGFGVFFDLLIGYILHRDWKKLKDTDDWWTGRGTRLKKRLQSMFTAPAAAGVGA